MTQDRPSTIGDLLDQTRRRLAAISASPGLDAQVLLAAVLGVERERILAHPELRLEAEQVAALTEHTDRLLAGEPLPYVLGWWEFYGRRYRVGPDVLIPRPETELLVEQALAFLHSRPGATRGLDVGTGSGCIAVTLAAECPALRMIATDLSLAALSVARANAAEHGVANRVDLVACDLVSPLAARFDLVCANLPYIPRTALPGVGLARREPLLALHGGEEGLDLILRLMAALPRLLEPDGLALMEIEAGQGEAVRAVARGLLQVAVEVRQDLAGRDRLLTLRRERVW
ncbi:MAG: peptide chain release factor N(5)-glutamine methyltransferase [Chloroflexota bacterium]